MKYRDFDSLPCGFKKRIIDLHPRDYKAWVSESIPALSHRSIIKAMNSEDGMATVAQYLTKIEGYLR